MGINRFRCAAKVEPSLPSPCQAFIKYSITGFGDNFPLRYQNGKGQSTKNDKFRNILKGINRGE
jgi:hypothetical protein